MTRPLDQIMQDRARESIARARKNIADVERLKREWTLEAAAQRRDEAARQKRVQPILQAIDMHVRLETAIRTAQQNLGLPGYQTPEEIMYGFLANLSADPTGEQAFRTARVDREHKDQFKQWKGQ